MVKYRKITYFISGTLAALSLAAIFGFGFNFGIDFTGGSLMEVEYKNARPEILKIKEALSGFELGDIKLQPSGEKNYILRFKDTDEETHQNILKALALNNSYELMEERFDSIGPVIGSELKQRALIAVLLASIMIILYITFAFRKVSSVKILNLSAVRQGTKKLSSIKYGIIAVIALLHDTIIPTGIFVFLGYFKGVEIDSLFVTAILTILGFSVHDTIVVFDRIRENLLKNSSGKFEDTVDKSIKETITRSINTSLTVLFVLFALFLFGGETTRYFALALILGIFFGTYSSIFLASPLLVSWLNFSNKKNKKF